MADFTNTVDVTLAPVSIAHSAAGAGDHADVVDVLGSVVLDAVPPTITIATTPGLLPGKNAPLIVNVTDDVAIGSVTILINFTTFGLTECAFHNGTFRPPYTLSTLVGSVFTIVRDGGWIGAFDLDVSAVDTSGNIQS